MKHSRRQNKRGSRRHARSVRRRQQRGRGTNMTATNFVFENPLQQYRFVPPMRANTRRVSVNEVTPVYATQGKATLSTHRHSLKNSNRYKNYVGISMNAASAANVNVVRNYTSPPVHKSIASVSHTPVHRVSEFTAETVSPQKMTPATSWLMHRGQMPGSRHLQI